MKIASSLLKDTVFRGKQKLAKVGYDPSSLSHAIENATDAESLLDAISNKVSEYEHSGRLTNKPTIMGSLLAGGPHTRTTGSPLLALGARAINTLRPGSVSYGLVPKVFMEGDDQSELVRTIGLSPTYYKRQDPEITQKIYDIIAAHEILEAEAMERNMGAITNQEIGESLGGAVGAALGAALALSSKQPRSTAEKALTAIGASLYGGLGGWALALWQGVGITGLGEFLMSECGHPT